MSEILIMGKGHEPLKNKINEYNRLKKLNTEKQVVIGYTYSMHNPEKKIKTLECPTCTEEINLVIVDGYTPNFCPSCGQKIRWIEE